MKTIMVTGCAGFIGVHTTLALLEKGYTVIGIDNLNRYYSRRLKEARLDKIQASPFAKNFVFIKADIADAALIRDELRDIKIDSICHLAAQAGVRYSIEHPGAYISSNIIGTFNLLEFAKDHKINQMVYASSSSVYGDSTKEKFSESDGLAPKSIYAATKAATESLCKSYHTIHNINVTGLRFFTVYGSWSRPDMAAIKFADAIYEGGELSLYNNGEMWRDFTHVSDIVFGIVKAIEHPSLKNEIINLGSSSPVHLKEFVAELEKCLGKKAIIKNMPMQPGDVLRTSADVSLAKSLLDYSPKKNIKEGIKEFSDWYLNEYVPLKPSL